MSRIQKQNFIAALSNDLNTAEARAAIFELVRAGNAAMDAGTRPRRFRRLVEIE